MRDEIVRTAALFNGTALGENAPGTLDIEFCDVLSLSSFAHRWRGIVDMDLVEPVTSLDEPVVVRVATPQRMFEPGE